MARLVIIVPIQAYLGADVDMNRANEVRPIFMRLGQVAQRTGCAILLIGHLNKAAGMQSLQRGLGSIDIAADEMLSGFEPPRETKTPPAKDLLFTLLAGGKQVLSEDIDKAALERGIPGRTVRDAKRELGDALKSKIVEGRKKVFWME